MHLGTYEDLLDLPVKNSTNYLSAPGLNTSGRKVELVARAFPAFEIKMNKISTSVELQSLKACVCYFSLFLKEQCVSWLFRTKYFEKKFNLQLFYTVSQTFILFWDLLFGKNNCMCNSCYTYIQSRWIKHEEKWASKSSANQLKMKLWQFLEHI